LEANTQGQEEEEAQVLDAQGVGSPLILLVDQNARALPRQRYLPLDRAPTLKSVTEPPKL